MLSTISALTARELTLISAAREEPTGYVAGAGTKAIETAGDKVAAVRDALVVFEKAGVQAALLEEGSPDPDGGW